MYIHQLKNGIVITSYSIHYTKLYDIVEDLKGQVLAKGGMGLVAFRIACADGKFLGYGTAVKADEGQFTMA